MVEGINGVYIGPSDLGFSYGLVPKLDRDEPEISQDLREDHQGMRQARPLSGHSLQQRCRRDQGDRTLGFKLVTCPMRSG